MSCMALISPLGTILPQWLLCGFLSKSLFHMTLSLVSKPLTFSVVLVIGSTDSWRFFELTRTGQK